MEIYSLNKKKVFFTIVFFILIIVTIFTAIFFTNNNNSKSVLITSADEKFTVSIPNTIEYNIISDVTNNFSIDLYSQKDEFFFYASSIQKLHEIDLYEISNEDKDNYLKNKQNVREVSNVSECFINNYKAYECSFVYFDEMYNKDFYCNIVWIETSNYIYVLNFEVILDNSSKYKDIFLHIKNSFMEL